MLRDTLDARHERLEGIKGYAKQSEIVGDRDFVTFVFASMRPDLRRFLWFSFFPSRPICIPNGSRSTSGRSLGPSRSPGSRGDAGGSNAGGPGGPQGPDNGGGGGNGAPPPPPQRIRKTHSTPLVSEALKGLSMRQKEVRNSQITERNAERRLNRAMNTATPNPAFQDSDDKSTITFDEPAYNDASPTKAILKALRTLPEDEGAVVLRALNTLTSASKRPREDNEDQAAAKKPRVEIELIHSLSPPVVYHQYLHDLRKHHVYVPLSLFTSPSLDFISSNAPTLEMMKTNTPYSGKEQVRLLSTAALEKACLKEEDMDRGQWQEASRNFIGFVGGIEGEDSAAQVRWDSHFAYFEKSNGAEKNFPAILKADIMLRRHYNSQPFIFSIDTYRHTLDRAISTMEIDKLQIEVSGERRPPSDPPRGPPSLHGHGGGSCGGGRGERGGRGGGHGSGRGGAPFQGGDGGAPPGHRLPHLYTSGAWICGVHQPPLPRQQPGLFYCPQQ
ncbi:hypothetical protein B0H19DRAFT_1086021 [Mycena capillaripes]|nr:hypothetical protein B0H19DRAFT_1086021 [Mycena capillaripes]